MKPLIIERGRSRIILSGNCLRMDFDGRGLIQELTVDERKRLSKALWYSTQEQ